METKKKNTWFPYLLMLPSLLVMVVIVIYPICNGIYTSFQQEEKGGLGFENYLYFLQDKNQMASIVYTLEIVLVTVVLAIGLAYLLAIYLRFSDTKVSRAIGKLYLIPRFIPALVAVNGMITIIRDSGLINRVSQLFGLNIKLGLMYDAKGIVLMNLWFNIPFATMMLAASLSALNNSEVEAARDAGASKMLIFRKLILPLTYRDLFVTATFVFMSNISSFTTPYLMGTSYPRMMGVSLFELYNNQHYGQAAALSVIMFLFSAVCAGMYIYVNMREDAWEKQA